MKNFKEFILEGEQREKRIQASYSAKHRELAALTRGDFTSVPQPKESSEFLFPGMDKELELQHRGEVYARKNELATSLLGLDDALTSAKAKNERRRTVKDQQIKDRILPPSGKAPFPLKFAKQMLAPQKPEQDDVPWSSPIKADRFGFIKRSDTLNDEDQ